MGSIAVTEFIQTPGPALPKESRPELPNARVGCSGIILRSRAPGRGRWRVKSLEDHPRLAAAVELILQGEAGIANAQANPLTGTVLVHFRPDLGFEWIEALIHRALEFGPMSREEFSALRSGTQKSFPLEHLLAAEVGCTALKAALFSGCCPVFLAAAGVLLLLHRRG